MDIFSQKKFLVIAIFMLIVLNIAVLGIFLWHNASHEVTHQPTPPPPSGEPHDVSAVLKNELSLSEKQVEQIQKIRADFFAKERLLSKIIRDGRDSMNVEMFNKVTNEELVKSIARRIAENEYQMEMLRVAQAQEFKSICTPEQLAKFEGLVREIRDYFKPDNPPKRK